ncbi:YihY/virulence factor BrkB family protein [Streptomyces sp. NPDC006552]|uniref:YihY/virulence factor BrkB family protein n=1 Tax=Streptomyces sp. NPDC006552 TaxID=3157179 RepID=UPI0033B5E997
MDWLKKLPVVGPLVARLMRTHAWWAYERLDEVHWTRLAAAMTFISFLALFPLITVAAAVAAGTLGASQQRRLESKISDQVPGIADQLDLGALIDNAGTIGVVAGALLLFTGVGWVGSMRECLRTVWELPDSEENPVLRKLKDAGVLVGLGGAGLASLVASTAASTAVEWTTARLGIDSGGWGGALLQILAFGIAVLADFLVLLYVLTLLPGVEPPRRDLLTAALIGAAGFELLKILLGGYMKGVAAKSMYGAFGTPVALLLWINFLAKLVLFCSAWTATGGAGAREGDEGDAGSDGSEGRGGVGAAGVGGGSGAGGTQAASDVEARVSGSGSGAGSSGTIGGAAGVGTEGSTLVAGAASGKRFTRGK